jgi:hypothetical protein
MTPSLVKEAAPSQRRSVAAGLGVIFICVYLYGIERKRSMYSYVLFI